MGYCASGAGMAGQGRTAAEKLRAYLRELKPGARALLIAELERGLLQGDQPGRGRNGPVRAAAQPARGPIQVRALWRSGPLVLPAARAVPGRRCPRSQASRPDRALRARADMALDQQYSDARRGDGLLRAGRAGADGRRHRQAEHLARVFQDRAVAPHRADAGRRPTTRNVAG